MREDRICFTLAEIVIVVIIIAILAMIGIPGYHKAVRVTRDKEAKAMLRLMHYAQKLYFLEDGANYAICNNTNTCNSDLHLDLPSGGSANWGYRATAIGCVEAVSVGVNQPIGRLFHMDITDTEPFPGSC